MDSLDSEKKPRIRKSCERCRGSKSRCMPGDSERCQKCIKDGKQCVFLEARPRPKRAKNSRLRVAEMEEKLDSLYAMLAKSGRTVEPSRDDISPTSTPLEAQDTWLSDYDMLPRNDTSVTREDNTNRSHYPTVFSGTPFPYLNFDGMFDGFNDVISRGMVTCEEAEACIASFRNKSAKFPFVIIPSYMSMENLRREKPFLLLAVLLVGLSENQKVKSALEEELREVLSRRVIINAEKSLDLLQGILVYLNYYHLYFSTDNQQMYQLCQIAASMTFELHLGRKTNAKAHRLAISIPGNNMQSPAKDNECNRTFLGCYYLTSSISLCLRRPSLLAYNSHIEECTQCLGQLGAAESDYLLPSFIEVQRLIEEVTTAFRCNVPQENPPSDSISIQAMLKSYQHRVSHLEAGLSQEARDNAVLAVNLHSLKIYLTEVGFHAQAPTPTELMTICSTESWFYASARGETLTRCLEAAKAYLDFFLNLPNEAIQDFGLTEYFRLVYGVLVLGQFTTGCDFPGRGSLQFRASSKLQFYLNALYVKMTSMIKYTASGEEIQDYIWHMRCIFQGSQTWYCLTEMGVGKANLQLDGTDLGFMDMLPTLTGQCIDGFPIYHKKTPLPYSSSSTTTDSDSNLSWPTDMASAEYLQIADAFAL